MNTLHSPALRQRLETLHAAAAEDPSRWAARRERQAREGRPAGPDPLIRMGELYIAVSPDDGQLLYLLARACRARTLVEFGASFGISTLYLGAAARDNGGHLHTTEVHPEKCRAVRDNLVQTALNDVVTLHEGDALQSLAETPQNIDLVFLDGWKSLYLPLLELLQPRLGDGALLIADNVDFEAAQDYLARVTAADSGFTTRRIGDLAISCFTG